MLALGRVVDFSRRSGRWPLQKRLLQEILSSKIYSAVNWQCICIWKLGISLTSLNSNCKDTGSNNARLVMVQWYGSNLFRSSGLSWMSFLTLELCNHSREDNKFSSLLSFSPHFKAWYGKWFCCDNFKHVLMLFELKYFAYFFVAPPHI